MRWWEFGFFAIIVPCIFFAGTHMGGMWHLATPLFVFGLVPCLDHMIGRDTRNLSDGQYTKLKNDRIFRFLTYTFVPIQWMVALGGAWALSWQTQPWWVIGLAALAAGMVTGSLGITLAHELGHRNNKFEQFMAKMLLAPVCYLHFIIEHNHGHHANVATPKDPATARFGESLYVFVVRSIFGSYQHAWGLEQRRLSRKKLAFWSHHNAMIGYSLCPILLGFAAWLLGGFPGLLYFYLQALVAVILLEMVNYIEHYGLQRRLLADGRYEKVGPRHSWNADHWLTNRFLFHLQRHSDHHANPTRRYQTLRHFDESPQLPTGYAGMILLAMIPPLWRRVMDPLVRAHQKHPGG
ncbi:alkane 1-monooxygenase [Acanthopleuribacter pedis]|uniref:Alkane 1-monooxygenase n=1 Tax=Acanthopleuribacter pedis TaxID=442870 RepID=A0A8J7U4V7_9BACT|nr:alkane 1-monooxygenase [Acanthopleuribacter pedis]MBO1320189.1 alkane 1-monooxygenase [Acanthopleuribacter pedis]